MDTTNINNVTGLPVFHGTNFSVWKARLLFIFREKHWLELIETEPTEAEIQNQEWKSRDNKAMNFIIRCIDDAHIQYVVDEQNSYSMLHKLENVFQRKTIGTKIHLRKSLLSLKCTEGKPLDLFFKEFDSAARAFKEAGGTLDQMEEIIHLLSAMPDSYSQVVTALETLDEKILTVERVKSRLLECELRQNTQKPQMNRCEDIPASFNASNKQIKCYICGKVGHKANKCYNKKKFKRQSNQAGPSSSKNNNSSCGSSSKSFAMTIQNEDFESDYKYCAVIDSGCTDHIINDENMIGSKNLYANCSINVAKQGETMNASKAGNLSISTVVDGREMTGTLHDVLLVENARLNLISVSQIDKKGGKVVFEKGKATIYMNGDVIGTGMLKNGLYWYNFDVNKQPHANFTVVSETDLWHKRLGHLNFGGLSKMFKSHMVTGVPTKLNVDKNFCETCVVAKQARNPFDGTRTRAKRPLELIHSDVCGPSENQGHDGSRYFVTFIDDWSHMVVAYVIKRKSEVFDCFKQYKAMVEAHHSNFKVSRLRCDNGGEYSSNEFKKYCREQGVSLEYTTAYSPQLNGVAERMNRTLVEKGRSLLLQANLPKYLWNESILTAVYLTNRSITNAVNNKTPYEMWYKSKPDLEHLRIFGSNAFVFVPQEKRSKFDDKSYRCLLVGYGPNGYRLWNPEQQTIVYSRDVKFNESVVGFENNVYEDFSEDGIVSNDDLVNISKNLTPFSVPRVKQSSTSTPVTVSRPSPNVLTPINRTVVERDRTVDVFETPNVVVDPPQSSRPKRNVRRPLRYDEYETDYGAHCAYNLVNDTPISYDDIVGREDEKEWFEAVSDEINSLNENETWTVVKNPGNIKLLGTRWIFKKKSDMKFKARLVAKGYMQKADVDYSETYSPVARLPTIRLLLAIGMHLDMEFCHMDVKTAFLHGFIEENIYLKPPEGIIVPEDHVLKLKKSLYGLKQSPRCWNDRFDKFITSIGFKRSKADYCLYVRITGEVRIYLVLYVDDLLLCSNNQASLTTVKNRLASEFSMKDLGEVKCFMGMNVNIDKENNVLTIDQHDYINRILNKFGMKDCNGAQTPLEQNLKLVKNEKEHEIINKPYREVIGSLMYLMLACRPDLCFSIGYLSRFQDKPTEEHWNCLKRVLRYLKHTENLVLTYTKEDSSPLIGYVDADWANDLNDRKSTSGFCFKVFGNTILWTSKKQGSVAKSTSEAEYVAAAEAVSEGIWLSKLLIDLQIDPELPFILYEDNNGTIFMSTNPETKRTKHIDIKFHYLRELVWEQKVKLVKIQSSHQIADVLTKPLSKILFWTFIYQLGLRRVGVLET